MHQTCIIRAIRYVLIFNSIWGHYSAWRSHRLSCLPSFFFILKLLLSHPYFRFYDPLLFLHTVEISLKTRNLSFIFATFVNFHQSINGKNQRWSRSYNLFLAYFLHCPNTSIFHCIIRGFAEGASHYVKQTKDLRNRN